MIIVVIVFLRIGLYRAFCLLRVLYTVHGTPAMTVVSLSIKKRYTKT